MELTLSVLKADVGSIGGHICPGRRLLDGIRDFVRREGAALFIDAYVGATGDDVAILVSHTRGTGDEKIHRLAWDAFSEGTRIAREQGLYGAGQDLLKDAFSGNVKGLGPAVAEMTFQERPNEPFVFFQADKTDPGAYNLPLYLAFADPMWCPGLLLSPKMMKGFRFTILDVSYTEADRYIELDAPEDLYDIAALLRDTSRFVVESVHSRSDGEIAAAVSTTRLHNIAGTYTGKDDPVLLVRTQGAFPATGEVLSPYAIGHLVAGGMRGSHNMPIMPVKAGTTMSFFDGPPGVSALAFCVHDGVLTEPADAFDHPFWEKIREDVSRKSVDVRRQGFFGAAMLGMNELEYTGVMKRLEALESRFTVREAVATV
ncbi:MAG: fructose-1,6-bisphosphate aldolase/phosphatase [Nitrospinota bacterium]